MAILKAKAVGRQYPLVARQAFTFADFAGNTGVALEAVDLPINAIVIGGYITTSVVFNSATSDTLTVSGGGVSTAALDADAAVIAPLAGVLVATGVTQTLGDTVDITWTGVGAVPTTGTGEIVVQYIIVDRATEVQPA